MEQNQNVTARANAAKDAIDQLVVTALVNAGYEAARIGSHEIVVMVGEVPTAVEISAKAFTSGPKRKAFDLAAAVEKYEADKREAEIKAEEKAAEKARKAAEAAAKKAKKEAK